MAQTDNLTEGTDLKQFIVLAKSSKGKACVAVIEKALAHPTVYVFSELLDMPNVQQLQQSEFKSYYDLLQIFTYGSYQNYKSNKDNLPSLSPLMITKLRQLTIVQLSSTLKVIPYSLLLEQLEIQNVRELEDLIIDSIYQNIIKGKLDQKNKHLEIHFAIGRDVPVESLDGMLATLEGWLQTSDKLLKEVHHLIGYTDKVHDQNRKSKEEFDKRVENAKQHVKPDQEMGNFLGMGIGGFDSMEYATEDHRNRKTKGKGKDMFKRP
ncbi:proteasome component region PCI domain-containing protein [Tieghemostelium lacteum]|uniref:Proteasome component region PCI domain-containing protein n=1 Tax=Tieghemostelium lacteum TaxID=361077 RepID=A0A152A6X6_TIELA|nr:proteasome component region PCI domain-containing protein [Tieghemostelium lacteum]|eukprot:KYR01956.1 proteasome component region PCI domain-containing protein [Tieghemostelium lacteum]